MSALSPQTGRCFHRDRGRNYGKIAGQKIFGAVETVERIDSHDRVHAAETASYRYRMQMRELEAHFEEEASALRAKYLAELNGEAKKTKNRAAAPMTALIGLSLYGLVQSVAVAAKGN